MDEDEKLAGYQDSATGSYDTKIVPEGASQVAPVSVPEMKSLLALAVGAVVIAALYFGRDVLIPITLAMMLSFVLSPVVNLLQRARLWRAPAVIISVLAALGLIGLLGTLIGTQAASLAVDAPRYAQTIQAKVQGVQAYANARLTVVTKALGGLRPGSRDASVSGPTVAGKTAGKSATSSPSGQRRPVLVEMENSPVSPLVVAKTILAPILGPLGTTIIVLIVTIFVLMQKEDLRDRFIRLFGSADLHRATLAINDAAQRLSRYFLSQLAVNASFGVVIGVGLWVIGIPTPAMWGILAGMLRFVPYIGSFLAAIAPIALGAAVDPGWSVAIYVALLFVIVEPLTGYVVEPLLYGHSTGLSPVSVIISAIFWSWLWGPIGLIISTPLTLCFVVMGRHVKSLEFFDVLLGDRPALSAVNSFYQRILADNLDEALAQAETLLVDHSLIAYYDSVAVPGLRLAVEDEARGTLSRERVTQMTRSMLAVVGELSDHAKKNNGEAAALPPDPNGIIACVSGRGSFDDVVTAMLAQLLDEHGRQVRSISHGAVSREEIMKLDLSGVMVIALSYVELLGSPAQLRYLIKRLRQRAPDARIIAGLWAEGEAVLNDTDLQNMIGANRYVGSLQQMIDAVIDQHAAHYSPNVSVNELTHTSGHNRDPKV